MKFLVFILLLTFSLSCSISTHETTAQIPSTEGFAENDTSQNNPELNPKLDSTRKFITDNLGKIWDVTTAFEKYGMLPEKFQFGIGIDAIKPVLNPRFAVKGVEGYPENNWNAQIFGVIFSGNEKRAYKRSDLSRHEVVDDKFGNQHVAVAY